jgi:hypothetical protein
LCKGLIMDDILGLEKRFKAALDRIASVVGTMPDVEKNNDNLAGLVGELEVALSRLKQSNTDLREMNQQLRDANSKGVGDPELINNALKIEIDNIRLEREAEKSQINIILAAITDADGEQTNA